MNPRRRIAVLTSGRSDYGLLYWTLKNMSSDPDIDLSVIVTGMHLSADFGETINTIESDGFPIAYKIETLSTSDTGKDIGESLGLGIAKLSKALSEVKPDILLLLGDRTDILAAAVASLPLLIPVAHIHGGESSEGAIDEHIRHAVTKLSHIHFTATEFYARRLMQLGEEEWRIHVSGAPGIEHIYKTNLPDPDEINKSLGINVFKPLLMMTYHPETLNPTNTLEHIQHILDAIRSTKLPVVITYPNSDMGGRLIIENINKFQSEYKKAVVTTNLGSRMYLGLLKSVSALIGNSSSGIIEAASFATPVVNIGDRQKGRLRGKNVIDVVNTKDAIIEGIKKAVDPSFVGRIKGMNNIYDYGIPSQTIVEVLKSIELSPSILRKQLIDLPSTLKYKPSEAL
jgi:GDP/UDP-N,N'-diacetylbacillosamine 2-epimerase (hydrolysing)